MQPRPSSVAGRYRVLDTLGAGGAAEVFRVEDGESGRILALKLMRPQGLADPTSLVQAFHREFEILTRLRHPHLVAVHDFGLTQGDEPSGPTPWFTMDLIDGDSAEKALAPPKSWETLARVADAVLSALEALHSQRLVHGDITTANILLGPKLDEEPIPVWLMDLGLVNQMHQGEDGVIRGTPATLAPETLKGIAVDGRADLYSLGCVLYRLSTGQDPFAGTSAWETIRAHLATPPTPPRQLNPEIPRFLDRLILELMSKDPADRPSTAGEVRRLLSELSGRSPSTPAALVDPLSPSFAGRSRETRAFSEALTELAAGRGGVLVVQGRPGFGLTRLLEEFRLSARLEGFETVLVKSSQASKRPFGVTDLLASRFDRTGKRLGVKSGSARERCERLIHALTEEPSVVLIDEAHLSDPASARRLEDYAQRIRGGSLVGLLVFGITEQEKSDTDSLSDRLLEGGASRVLRLRPLDERASGSMAASMLGRAQWPASWDRAVHERTGGVPLLITDLISALVKEREVGPSGELPKKPEQWLAELRFRTRRSETWLSEHWNALSETQRAVLAAVAAGWGEAVPFSELETLEPRSATDPAAVTEVTERGLLMRVEDADGRLALALASPSLANAILAEVSAAARETLHLRWATVLEGKEGQEAARARHLLEAGESEQGIDLLVEAAAAALAAGIPGETIRLADEVLAGASGESQRPAREAALRRMRARALGAQGFADQAEEEFDRAIASARRRDDGWELAMSLRDAGAFRAERGIAGPALANLEEALALLDELADVAQGAHVLLELGRLLERTGRIDEAEARLASAISQARRAGRPDLEAEVLVSLGDLAARCGRSEQAGEHFRAAEIAAARVGDNQTQVAARRGKILALQAAGRIVEALAESERYHAVARESSHREAEAEALGLIGDLSAKLGRRSAAFNHYEAAERLRVQLGQSPHAAELHGRAAGLMFERGQIRSAQDRAREAIAQAKRCGSFPAEQVARRVLDRIDVFLGRFEPDESTKARSDDIPARAERALSIGLSRLAGGRFQDAREVLQESCFLARRARMPDLESEGLLGLAETYLEVREDERASLALKKIRASRSGTVDEEVLARLRILEAERELAKPDGDLIQARDEAEQATRTLDERERGDIAWRAWAALSKAAQRLGDSNLERQASDEAFRRLDALITALPDQERDRWRQRPRVQQILDQNALAASASVTGAKETQAERSSPDESAAHAEKLERLLEINRALNSTLDLPRVLEILVDTALDLTGAERGFVLLEAEGRSIREVARGRGGADLTGDDREHSRGIARRVMKEGQTLLAHDALTDSRLSKSRSVHAMQIRSVLAVPLRVRTDVVGAMVVDSRHAAGMFGLGDQDLLVRLSDQAGIALANARLVEELRRQADEIRTLNEMLEEKVEQQRVEILEKQSNLEIRFRYDSIIGASPPMQKVYKSLDKIAPTDIPVLVGGESGTGKDLIAQVLHYNGPRKKGRFVTVNCAALTDTLLESELFGHRRGAFTGADRDRKGLFDQANGGTLFLDEIGEMPLALQPKLLRALQSGEIRRVGEDTPKHVDVRVIAATNKNLATMVKERGFREDLFYRLDVARIDMAPLRERMEDIGLLVDHFLEIEAERSDSAVRKIEPAALRLFLRYDWPGNVRELQNEVIKLAAFSESRIITEVDVLENATFLERVRRDRKAPPSPSDGGKEIVTLGQSEIDQIREALRKTQGNRTRAAELLGIDRSTLYRKLKKLDDILDGER